MREFRGQATKLRLQAAIQTMALSRGGFVPSLENLPILICTNPRNSGTGANFAAFAKFVACTRITPRTDPRNSATGANFAACAKFVACTRITPRTNPRNSATGANLPIFIWAGEVYLMEDSLENLAILICTDPRNSATGANFAACAKFVACTRITPRTDPRNSATGANLPIFIWAGEVYLMEDCPRNSLRRPVCRTLSTSC
jgi:hypothetical protein